MCYSIAFRNSYVQVHPRLADVHVLLLNNDPHIPHVSLHDVALQEDHVPPAGQATAVVVVTGAVVMHPFASVTVIVCGPADTPVNEIIFAALVCVTVPSMIAVNGAAPLPMFIEMLPLLTPGQVVPVGVGVATRPAPAATTILFKVN